MRAIAEADGGGRPRHLFLRDDMFQITEAKAAISLLHGDAVQAKRAHFGPQVAREPVPGIDLRRQRRDAIGSKTRRRLADHFRIIPQREVEISHGGSPCGASYRSPAFRKN